MDTHTDRDDIVAAIGVASRREPVVIVSPGVSARVSTSNGGWTATRLECPTRESRSPQGGYRFLNQTPFFLDSEGSS